MKKILNNIILIIFPIISILFQVKNNKILIYNISRNNLDINSILISLSFYVFLGIIMYYFLVKGEEYYIYSPIIGLASIIILFLSIVTIIGLYRLFSMFLSSLLNIHIVIIIIVVYIVLIINSIKKIAN